MISNTFFYFALTKLFILMSRDINWGISIQLLWTSCGNSENVQRRFYAGKAKIKLIECVWVPISCPISELNSIINHGTIPINFYRSVACHGFIYGNHYQLFAVSSYPATKKNYKTRTKTRKNCVDRIQWKSNFYWPSPSTPSFNATIWKQFVCMIFSRSSAVSFDLTVDSIPNVMMDIMTPHPNIHTAA